MDSTLISYSVSFVGVLGVLYWKMNKQITGLLEAKQQGMQEAVKTAEYMNNISVAALYEEAQKNGQIEAEISLIKANGQVQIDSLRKKHQDFKESLRKQFEQDLDEHVLQINGQFLENMKEEFSELIALRLQKRLEKNKLNNRPQIERFALDMQIQCG